MDNKKQILLKLILSFLVSLFILIFVFQRIDIRESLISIRKANLYLVFLTLLISVVNNLFINSYRWVLILRSLNCNIKWREAWFIKAGSEPVVMILPFKVGEFSKALYLKKKNKISYSNSLLSIFCEYVFNLAILIVSIFVGGGLYFFGCSKFPELIFLKDNIGVALCLSNSSTCFKKFYARFGNKLFSTVVKYIKKIKPFFKNIKIIILTVAFLSLELGGVYLLAQAIDISLPIYSILLFIPIVILASNMPITIYGIGIREASILFLFANFAPQEKLFSLSVLYFTVENLFPIFIGTSLAGVYLNRIVQRKT